MVLEIGSANVREEVIVQILTDLMDDLVVAGALFVEEVFFKSMPLLRIIYYKTKTLLLRLRACRNRFTGSSQRPIKSRRRCPYLARSKAVEPGLFAFKNSAAILSALSFTDS